MTSPAGSVHGFIRPVGPGERVGRHRGLVADRPGPPEAAAAVARLARIARVIARHALAHVAKRALAAFAPRRAAALPDLGTRLRDAIEELGGAAVKLGQMLSTHPDLVRPAVCRALSGLIDQMRPIDPACVEAIITAELGQPAESIFDSFGVQPVAAGSIGQVHRAVWRGRPVAVKVRRPTVPRDFAVDLRLLEGIVWLVDRRPLRSLRWVATPLREFVEWTREELDFSSEARRQDDFAACGGGDACRRVPRIHHEVSTARVLTMDWLEGPTLMELLRGQRSAEGFGEDRSAFARCLIHSFFADALRNGIFHCDLHPANVLLLADGRVGYVDFGITGELDEHDRWHLVAMTFGYADRDARAIATSFLELATDSAAQDDALLVQGLDRVQEEWAKARSAGQAPSITKVMMDLLALSRRTGVWPRCAVVRYIRSVIVLDGLVKSLGDDCQVEREIDALRSTFLAWRLLGEEAEPTAPQRRQPEPAPTVEQRELETVRRAICGFGFARPSAHSKQPAHAVHALSRREPTAVSAEYEALWRIEGLGYRQAERIGDPAVALRRALAPSSARTSRARQAAMYVGTSLSLAKATIGAADDGPSLDAGLRRFLTLTEGSCPPQYAGLACEALGLVVRTLRPGLIVGVDRRLGGNPTRRAHFWHGVGRGLYFLYPRALFRRRGHWLAYEAIDRGVRDPAARTNAIAGLAFPLTLINLPEPDVLASYVMAHGEILRREPAFAGGVTNALLLWLYWAGDEGYVGSLHKKRPNGAGDREVWSLVVRESCDRALTLYRQASPPCFSQLFRYSANHSDSPSTSQLSSITNTLQSAPWSISTKG